jgi:hypothetical protein
MTDPLLSPTTSENRAKIVAAIENWKRTLYPDLPGGPLPAAEGIPLTVAIVAWRDCWAKHIDTAPLDEVRRLLARRLWGKTVDEDELVTAGERAARVCHRLIDWVTQQTHDEALPAVVAGSPAPQGRGSKGISGRILATLHKDPTSTEGCVGF